MGQFDGYNTGVFRKAGAFGRAQALYLCTEKENRAWEKEILVRCQVLHVAKIVNSSSFERNNILYPEKLPHSHQAPTGGAGRVIALQEESSPYFTTSLCHFRTPIDAGWGQALPMAFRKAGRQWIFIRKQTDISQFSVWTKSREHFIWREPLPSWGWSCSVLASFGDSTLYQELFGSIPLQILLTCSLSKSMEPHQPSHRHPKVSKPRSATPLQVTGAQQVATDKEGPLSLQGSEHTWVTLTQFPKGWICPGKAEGCIKWRLAGSLGRNSQGFATFFGWIFWIF